MNDRKFKDAVRVAHFTHHRTKHNTASQFRKAWLILPVIAVAYLLITD